MRAAGSAGHWDCFWLLVAVMAVLGGGQCSQGPEAAGEDLAASAGRKQNGQSISCLGWIWRAVCWSLVEVSLGMAELGTLPEHREVPLPLHQGSSTPCPQLCLRT